MYVCEFPNNLPFLMTKTQGWSNRKSLKELHSGSTCGSRHRHVGLKKGNAWSVRRAAWHFVTVTVEQATERKREILVHYKFVFKVSTLNLKDKTFLLKSYLDNNHIFSFSGRIIRLTFVKSSKRILLIRSLFHYDTSGSDKNHFALKTKENRVVCVNWNS